MHLLKFCYCIQLGQEKHRVLRTAMAHYTKKKRDRKDGKLEKAGEEERENNKTRL